MDNIAALVAEAREQPLPSFIPRSEIIRELAEPARFNLGRDHHRHGGGRARRSTSIRK